MTKPVLVKRMVFGILVMIMAPSIGLEPLGAASNPRNEMLQFGKSSALTSEIPAFPGAEGFGAYTVGGRGGKVIEVTNLNDCGPGSLRAAIETRGPRIVVFRIGGTIELKSALTLRNPFITIAGQTAPGGGITLKNRPSNTEAPMVVGTHDVIIRYIRMRPGPPSVQSTAGDALSIGDLTADVYNVIIDHSSFSWATDEVVDTWLDVHDITIQWSIISEGLHNSTHKQGPHSMGMLLGSQGSGNISIHHNLFAHNKGRNPRVNTGGVVDIVNNVIYNPGDHPSTIDNEWHPVPPVNYVGNFYKMGDNSKRDYLVNTKGKPAEIYVQGNITPNRPTNDLDEVEYVVEPGSMKFVVPTMHPVALVTTLSGSEAYDQVLTNAGATLPQRDAVDKRIVNDVINGTGKIINDPSEVGGWPQLAAGTPPLDSDHDGMPNGWENLYGFNLNDPSDGNADADGDGYTNIEEYLNGTVPTSDDTPPVLNVFEVRVSTGVDDAEEIRSNGKIKLGNDDLELTKDGSNKQIVGIRFQNITIPQNAFISNAYIKFETDETKSVPTSLTIRGQASNSAPAFQWCKSACFELSSRPKTSVSVAWHNIPPWNTVDEKHQTPNLAPIVQEIVNRPGWVSGNDMAFLITGSGTRTAESYDGEPSAAPLLHIEYNTAPPPFAIKASTANQYHIYLPILFKDNCVVG